MLTVSTGKLYYFIVELVSLDVHEEFFDVTGYFIYVLGSMEICLVYTILCVRFYIYLSMCVGLCVVAVFQVYYCLCCFCTALGGCTHLRQNAF